MGADVAMAFAVLLGAGQIADSGLADVAVWAEFLAVDHVQPGIDSHALDATAAEFALRFVGIELGRANGRWRVTSPALSVAGWVHSSTVATFPEAPL